MRKYTFTDGGYTFERVSKATARKAYKNGLRVLLCPVNLRPGYPFHPETSISCVLSTLIHLISCMRLNLERSSILWLSR